MEQFKGIQEKKEFCMVCKKELFEGGRCMTKDCFYFNSVPPIQKKDKIIEIKKTVGPSLEELLLPDDLQIFVIKFKETAKKIEEKITDKEKKKKILGEILKNRKKSLSEEQRKKLNEWIEYLKKENIT